MSVLKAWRILPARGELAVRGLKWLQQIVANPKINEQLISAIWGDLVHGSDENKTLDAHDRLRPKASPFAKNMASHLQMYEGISGTEDFFELWQESGQSWTQLLSNEDLKDALSRIDAQILSRIDAQILGRSTLRSHEHEDMGTIRDRVRHRWLRRHHGGEGVDMRVVGAGW